MDVEIRYSNYFSDIFVCEERYLIMYGGAGSGKSYHSALKIIQRCLNEKGHRILLVRKVARTIKESVFKIIYDILLQHDLLSIVSVNLTDKSFKFSNGNEIITTGLDDVEKLKSIHAITSIWIEEATELEKGDLDQLDLRLRGDTANYKQIIITFNPIDETHWLHSEFFDKEVLNTYKHWSNYTHNDFIDDEYLKVLNERIAGDENMYRIYVLGKWGRIKTGGEFITSFNYSKHVRSMEVLNEVPVHISFDQNVVPYLSCICSQITKQEDRYVINVFKEFALANPNNKTPILCREIKENIKQSLYIYGDVSGRKRDTRNNRNDYDIIQQDLREQLHNSSMRVPLSNPNVNKTRIFLNKIFSGNMPIDIFISPNCKHLISDIENIKEDATGGMLKEKFTDKLTKQTYEKYGHHLDCLRYFLCEAFKGYFNR